MDSFSIHYVFYFCALFTSTSSSIRICESHHMPEFDGKKISDSPLATYQGLQFVWDCTRRCWENCKCRSYMFNRGTGLCSTFAFGYSDVNRALDQITDEAGAKLYTACGRNAPNTKDALCGTCDLLTHHLPDFDGKKVFDFPLATFQGLQFVWNCTRRCLDNHKCRSYMFNKGTGFCSTFAVGYSDVTNTFTPISNEAGTKLYTACGHNNSFGTRCQSDADCDYTNAMCSTGLTKFPRASQSGTSRRCVCAEGYSFDPPSGNCVERCDEYGDYTTGTLRSSITGHNSVSKLLPTLEACLDSCISESYFICVNFDYSFDEHYCNMCYTAWHDVSSSAHEHNSRGWVFFQRSCKV